MGQFLILVTLTLTTKNKTTMARKITSRKSNPSVVVIVDGKDEKWYIQKVKEHYKPNVLRQIKIVPELAQKKKIAQLFADAKDKLAKGYTQVILIVDFDDVGKDKKELEEFKMFYSAYISMNLKNGEVGRKYQWMANLILIINSPCVEYWYMLHFRKITKYYPNYAQLKHDLKLIPMLQDYDKDEDYYNKHPDIFMRLGGDDGLKTARKNAIDFDLEQCKNKGFSEMYKLFDFFDNYQS